MATDFNDPLSSLDEVSQATSQEVTRRQIIADTQARHASVAIEESNEEIRREAEERGSGTSAVPLPPRPTRAQPANPPAPRFGPATRADGTVIQEGVGDGEIPVATESPRPRVSPAPATPGRASGISVGDLTINPPLLNQDRIFKNSLDCYTNVTYNLQLALIKRDIAVAIQRKENTSEDLTTMIREEDMHVIASTGDVGTTTPGWFNYLNIKSLVLNNMMAHTAQNPMMSTLFEAKMTMVEPHGFSFNENIRRLAAGMGWQEGGQNIIPGRYIYRLDVWWSGYDPERREWVEKICLLELQKPITQFSFLISIPQIEATVTPAGAEYECVVFPHSSFAFRPEDFTFDAEGIDVGDGTFGTFLKNFAAKLEEQHEKKSHKKLLRKYTFVCPDILAKEKIGSNTSKELAQAKTEKSTSGKGVTFGQSMDIATVIRKVMADMPFVQQAELQYKNNDDGLTPMFRWNIRFNTIYGQIDKKSMDEVGDFKEVKYEYFIEPHVTFRKPLITTANRAIVTSLKNQHARAKIMIDRLGMVHRVYDFYFTGGNTEILMFDFKFKTFYFEALPPIDTSLASIGSGTPQTARNLDERALQMIQEQDEERNTVNPLVPILSPVTSAILGLNTIPSRPDGIGTTDIIGSMNLWPKVTPNTADTSDSDKLKLLYDQHNDEMLRNDQMQVEFTVRGDPIWFFNPLMANGEYGARLAGGVFRTDNTNNDGTKTLRTYTDRCIFIRAFAPTQDDFMDPSRKWGASNPTLLAGFYQVMTVSNEFQNGKFTQKIKAIKVTHLNYLAAVSSFVGRPR